MQIPAPIEELLKGTIGLDIEAVGASGVAQAMQQRRTALGLASEGAYIELLNASEREREELIERIVVPETWFFRDEKPFQMLQKYVAEEWLPTRPTVPLRLMSIPCSSGEEPFSMAMALLDIGLTPKQMQIDAYDVSRSLLAKARHAVYGKNSFRGNELSFRDRYFRSTPSGHEVGEAVRRAVAFDYGNILDPAFAEGKITYQVIFFRNLMIYLSRDNKLRALASIERLLAPSGLLFIGHAESSPLMDHWFSSVRYPFAFAYRKSSDERRKSPAQAVPEAAPCKDRRKPGLALPHSPPPHPSVKVARPSLPKMTPPLPPPDQSDLLEKAHKLADQGKLKEARNCCETVLSDEGPRVEAYYLLGLIHDADGNADEAERCFHKAVYLEPNHFQALTHLALAAERRGDLKAARLFRQRAGTAGLIKGTP